jgi:hypothetical protein
MPKIEVFLQAEGSRRIELIELDAEAPVREIIASSGLRDELREGANVFGPDGEAPLDPDATLRAAGVGHRDRIHVNRCRQVAVTIHFNDITEELRFPPSTTVDRVKRRFVQKIRMSDVDATEHVLQLCSSDDRPEPDNQIGSLVSGCCTLCFNLVPIKRIEG